MDKKEAKASLLCLFRHGQRDVRSALVDAVGAALQKIRKYLKKTLYGAGVPKIEIERSADTVTIFLHCARPGVVIGKGGEQIEQYRLAVEKLIMPKLFSALATALFSSF